MVCRHGGLIVQRHNEIRDLEAEMLRTVCTDVEIEPVLQGITGKKLSRGANKAPDARLDVHARGFWDRQQSAFFDVRVCHPNADSYRELSPKQIFQLHENEKKRQYSRRVLEVEQGSFTPLVFTSTGGMADECKRFHSRLAELLGVKERRWLHYKHFLDKSEGILCHSTISLAVSQRNQEKEKSSQYVWHWHYIRNCASQSLNSDFFVSRLLQDDWKVANSRYLWFDS